VAVTDEREWLAAVGMRVRLGRVARGESQQRLGDRCGVSRVTVGSIERGDHPASVTAYRRLADALGIDLARLLRPLNAEDQGR
jgi:transcriptional regulator with XRE-family HTH domain